MFISHSSDEKTINDYYEMEEENEDLSFQDIGIIPSKFISIKVNNTVLDGNGYRAKTLYNIETRIRGTSVVYSVSRRYKEFLNLHGLCVKLTNVVLADMPEKKPFST